MDGETYKEFFRALYASETDVIIALIEANKLGLDEVFDYGAPIHNAGWTGNAELARRLGERGADVNIVNPKDGLTPLHAAVGYNHLETTRVMLELGADVNATTVFAGHSHYTWSPHFGETPLHLAVLFCGTEMVQLLLDAGAIRDAQDGASATPQDYLKRKKWIKCEQNVPAMMSLIEQ